MNNTFTYQIGRDGAATVRVQGLLGSEELTRGLSWLIWNRLLYRSFAVLYGEVTFDLTNARLDRQGVETLKNMWMELNSRRYLVRFVNADPRSRELFDGLGLVQVLLTCTEFVESEAI